MKKILLLLLLGSTTRLPAQLTYPVTRKVDTITDYHGTKVADPYRWLEDDRSEETKAWVTAQNKVTFDILDKIPYRADWQKRLEEINNYPKYSSPSPKSGYYYFYKNDGLQNQSVLYRQKGLSGQPEVVLDPNKFSADGTTGLAIFSLSKDGNYAVVGKTKGGSDWRTLYIMDTRTLSYLPDSIEWVKVSGASWQKDGFFYSRYPATEKGKELSTKNENHQVYFHRVGTSQSADQLVYEDPANPQRFHGVFTDETERYVFLNISDRGKGKDGNALWYYDSQQADKTFKPLIRDAGDYSYNLIAEENGRFLLLTNDGAKNRRIIMLDPSHPEKENWTTIIGEKPENITSVSAAGGKLFVSYLKDVTSRIYVHDMKGQFEKEVKLPSLGSAGGFGGEKNYKEVFYTFTSITMPPTIYRYDIETGMSTIFRKPELQFIL